jgi:hypothetical protein
MASPYQVKAAVRLVKQRTIVSPLMPWVNLKRVLNKTQNCPYHIFGLKNFFTGIISSPIAMESGHGDPDGKEMDLQDKARM